MFSTFDHLKRNLKMEKKPLYDDTTSHLCTCPARTCCAAPCCEAAPPSLWSSDPRSWSQAQYFAKIRNKNTRIEQKTGTYSTKVESFNIHISYLLCRNFSLKTPIFLSTICRISSLPSAVSLRARVLSVQSVSVDDKCIEGGVAGQPDLLQGPVLHKHALQVSLPTLLVQICKMENVNYSFPFLEE